jgi:hypothetical protein
MTLYLVCYGLVALLPFPLILFAFSLFRTEPHRELSSHESLIALNRESYSKAISNHNPGLIDNKQNTARDKASASAEQEA